MNLRHKYLFLYLREIDRQKGEDLRARKNVENRIDFILHNVEFDLSSLTHYKRQLYEWSHIFDKHIAGMSLSSL